MTTPAHLVRCLPLALVILAPGAVACSGAAPSSPWLRPGEAGSPLVTGPYIILDRPGKAFIVMKTELGAAPPVVRWWPLTDEEAEEGLLEEIAPEGAPVGDEPSPSSASVVVPARWTRDLAVAALRDLPLESEIAYRVRVGDWVSEVYQFRSGRRRDEPFRFAAFGDTRTRHAVHSAVIDALDKEDIDFVVHTGDMVHRGGVREQWDQFFQIERPLLVDTPIFPSIGNHDVSRRDYYERYFRLTATTGGRRYFSYDFGDVRLVALDGGIEGRKGSAQYSYAARALREAAEQGMFSVVYLHWPPYSCGNHGSQIDVRRPIEKLAKTYGVELVIAGHDHNYERTIPIDGTTYLVSGSAGAPTRNVHPQWFTAEARTEPHYVLIDVVPGGSLTIRAVNLEGVVFDAAVIQDNPPGGAAGQRVGQSG